MVIRVRVMGHGDSHHPPTLADVARQAGVSRSLASLALRGEPGVRADKRERVLRAAAELDYQPNLIARNLASSGAHSLGVVIGRVLDPLQAAVAREVGHLAAAAGFDVLFSIDADTDEAAEKSVRMLMARRVAGVLLIGAPREKRSIARVAGMVTATYIGRLLATVEIESVSTDDRLGARLAVEHLIALGHRAIAHIDGGNEPGAVRRREGYAATMSAHGLKELVVEGGYTVDAGAAGAISLLGPARPRPTAIFAAHDLSAFGVMSEAHRMRLVVPDDLSVIGYGDVELAATDTWALTTIVQPARLLAEAGVSRIIKRIESPSATVTKTLVEPALVVRRSTAAPVGIDDRSTPRPVVTPETRGGSRVRAKRPKLSPA